MSKTLIAAVLTLFSGALAAQATIDTVIHEPTAADAGPTLGAATVPNPDYNPLQPNGQPQFLPLIGNGNGISNELDSISDEFYALGGTSTHDLAIMTNNTGADITVDPTTLQVAQIRPKVVVAAAPEQASPGFLVAPTPYPFSNASFTIANGTSSVLLLLVTKWMYSLDTSPRDYIITFQFNNTAAGGGPMTIDAPLTVPEVGGGSGSGGCVATEGGSNRGMMLLAGGAMFAIVSRRKLFQRA